MYNHQKYIALAEVEDIPHVADMLRRLDVYAKNEGQAPLGSFLTALVIGDLSEAVGQADDCNKKYLQLYVRYIYNELPLDFMNLGRSPLAAIRHQMAIGPVTRARVTEATEAFRVALRGKG